MDKVQYFYKCCSIYKEKWINSSTEFPHILKPINTNEKRENEIKAKDLIDKVINHLDKCPSALPKKRLWKTKGEIFINKIIENDNIFKLQNMKKDMRKGIIETTKKFVKKAREFDNNLGSESIFQALRNVWIISILQACIEGTQRFSLAVFGYSMLYPYTDNFLDDLNISLQEKKEFNQRLCERLNGNNISPLNAYESKVFNLVENIEKTFNRNEYQDVYKSLLLIQASQSESLNQQNNDLIEEKILEISIEKGGSSVLVDGFLINGNLTFDEIRFCTGYGVFLQLADDLQDLKEDNKNKHNTIMTIEANKGYLDNYSNKLLSFMTFVLENYKWNDDGLKEIVTYNCIMLVLFSIVLNKEYFSKEYINKISKYIPFSIGFIEDKRKDLLDKIRETSFYSDNSKTMAIIDAIIL